MLSAMARVAGRQYTRAGLSHGTAAAMTRACTSDSAPGPKKPKSLRKRRRSAGARAAVGDTFVSEHFSLLQDEVETYLERHRLAYRRSGAHLVIEICPFCHSTKGKEDNMHKLYILTTTGVFMCHRCGAKGSWFDFRRQVGGAGAESASVVGISALNRGSSRSSDAAVSQHALFGADGGSRMEGAVMPGKGRQGAGKEHVPRPDPKSRKARANNLWNQFPSVRRKLKEERGLGDQVLKKYGVGAEYFSFPGGPNGGMQRQLCYTFPMYNAQHELVRYKVRAVEQKSAMRLEPKGGDWGLFGLDTVPASVDEVVLTEGEFDAMAVFQATGRPTISLPNGASSLPVSLLPALERFKRIYLWMDDDVPGREGAKQFAKKLGLRRCVSVRSGGKVKDANEALLQRLDLSDMLDKASVIPHEGLATFRDLREEVLSEFTNPIAVQGLQCALLPRFNGLLKGHRRGELSIFSGHTGVGKTTLLSQLALDYCMQGVPTLWGSFELSNVRLAKLMLTQFYSCHTGRSAGSSFVSEFDEWAEKFEALPMYFMRYYGSNPIERIVDAMEYSNYAYDCAHVLLDNLQFMTSGQGGTGRNGRARDRFEVMDQAVEELRRFCTTHNVHISLVVHPRKENDDIQIQTASIFGSAKATQEADNLVILQRTESGPVLDVRKNRFDGTRGTIGLRFNTELRLFEERDSAKRVVKAALTNHRGRQDRRDGEAVKIEKATLRAAGLSS